MRTGLNFVLEVFMYGTNDLYLAAAVQEAGYELREVSRQGTRAVFIFDDGQELRQAISRYFSGDLLLRAHPYAERIRSAKSMAMNAQQADRE
jgi:hypothetical protein